MRVTCPNCLTEYDVPDEAVAGRPRTVRCAHCGHQWRHGAAPEEETVQPDDLAEPNPAPDAPPLIDAPPLLPPAAPDTLFAAQPASVAPPRAPLPKPPRRNHKPAIVAALILVLVVIVLAAHRPIMRVWPASAGFYQALGLS